MVAGSSTEGLPKCKGERRGDFSGYVAAVFSPGRARYCLSWVCYRAGGRKASRWAESELSSRAAQISVSDRRFWAVCENRSPGRSRGRPLVDRGTGYRFEEGRGV